MAQDEQTTDEQTSDDQTHQEQTVTVEDIGPARKRLVIEIPPERITEALASNLDELRNDTQVPGFRKGRAPLRLIERRFGTAVRDDVRDKIISEGYSQAVEDENLDVIGEPDVKDIDAIKLPDSGPMKFEVEVEVAPAVELPPLEGIKITKTSHPVTDADIDNQVERFCKQYGTVTPVKDGDAQYGDALRCDVRILAGEDAADDAEELLQLSDVVVDVSGEDDDYMGHVCGILIDDLGKQLQGKRVGDDLTFSMTGPSAHENERIKDQPITIKLAINELHRLEPADVEALIAMSGTDSLDQLRDQFRANLVRTGEDEQRYDMQEQVSRHLSEQIDLELPEGLTGRQSERALLRRQLQLQYQGVPEQEVEQRLAEMRAGTQAEAKEQLKRFFILAQAAKTLQVEATDAEVNGRIVAMARRQNRRPEKMRQQMRKSGEMEYLYLQIRETKTLDAIIDKAEVGEAKGEQAEATSEQAEATSDQAEVASDQAEVASD